MTLLEGLWVLIFILAAWWFIWWAAGDSFVSPADKLYDIWLQDENLRRTCSHTQWINENLYSLKMGPQTINGADYWYCPRCKNNLIEQPRLLPAKVDLLWRDEWEVI